MRGRRAFFIVDGLPLWLVRKAVALFPERLPTLATLMQEGRCFGMRPLEPNCQTPPSIAALLTGGASHETGITGFDMPDFSRAGVHTRRGFSSLIDGVDPIWQGQAEAGHDIHVAHLPYMSPERLGDRLKGYVHGFGPPLHAPQVLDPNDAAGLLGQDAVDGLPRDDWKTVSFGSGEKAAEALVRRCRIDGADRIIFTGAWTVRQWGAPIDRSDGAVTFHGSGLEKCYRRGDLGRTLMQGGKGAAEVLFIESIRLLASYFWRDWIEMMKTCRTGFVAAYQPAIDLVLHELAGFVAADCAHWSASREQVVMPLLTDLLADLDAVLGQTRALAGEDDRIVVTSDHGMAPVDLIVRPNVLLKARGWIETDEGGAIAPLKSLAFFHPAENGLLCLNLDLIAESGTTVDSLLATLLADMREASGREPVLSEWPDLECLAAPPAGLSARHFLCGGRFVQLRPDISGAAAEASIKTGEHVSPHQGLQELVGTVLDLSPKARPFIAEVIPITKVHTLLGELMPGAARRSPRQTGGVHA